MNAFDIRLNFKNLVNCDLKMETDSESSGSVVGIPDKSESESEITQLIKKSLKKWGEK